jgi:hypothetical protein
MKKITVVATSLALFSSFLFTSCDEPTALGAMAGAGAGALIGGTTGNRSAGRALAGAGIGAATGALIGHIVSERRREEYYEGGRSYPYGEPTGTSGIVRSPYYPYALIDVRGIPRGALVEDPRTGKPFVRP